MSKVIGQVTIKDFHCQVRPVHLLFHDKRSRVLNLCFEAVHWKSEYEIQRNVDASEGYHWGEKPKGEMELF